MIQPMNKFFPLNSMLTHSLSFFSNKWRGHDGRVVTLSHLTSEDGVRFPARPWILQREEKGCYRTILDDLIATDLPGYRNFPRMELAFFDLIEERINPHLRKSETNFRKPLEVGLKLAVTLRHLSTGECYTSLQYHWRVGRTIICKFIPKVCRAMLHEFKKEFLICPTETEAWKSIEEKFRNRWNVPHAVGALDGKHIAIKKLWRSGSGYFNYKGYFSLVLLALMDAEYKFLWVNVGASGSSSDAQIFNRSKLKKRLRMAS